MKFSEFRHTVQKGDEENYLIDKYLFRRISVIGSFILSKTGLSPNMATLLSLFCSLGAIWFFLQIEAIYLVVGCVLAFLYHYLDHVDGELARFYYVRDKRRGGIAGSYFDVLCHSYSVNLWLLAITFSLYAQTGSQWLVLVGIAASAGTSSYPRLVGSRILALRLAKDHTVLGEPAFQDALAVTGNRSRQVAAIQAGLRSRQGQLKLAKELVGYPGMILLVIVGVLVDAVTGETFGRTTLLVGLALVHCVNGAVTTRNLMRVYREVN